MSSGSVAADVNKPAKRPPQTAKPTTVLLVRHGKTASTGKVLPGRAPGLHLDDTGRQQAERAAELLGGVSATAVYCSPLERTRETAAPIAAAFGLRPKVERGLLEADFGEWTGAELKRLAKTPEWRQVQHAPSSFRFPGGESFAEMQFRIVGCIETLRRRHQGETIVCVSHADPIKALLADALGVHLDLFQRIVISPCAVSAVTWAGVSPAVLALNVTGRPIAELALS